MQPQMPMMVQGFLRLEKKYDKKIIQIFKVLDKLLIEEKDKGPFGRLRAGKKEIGFKG